MSFLGSLVDALFISGGCRLSVEEENIIPKLSNSLCVSIHEFITNMQVLCRKNACNQYSYQSFLSLICITNTEIIVTA